MSCFTNVAPINPINQLVLSIFGDNYFPPYSTEFQPPNKNELTNETLLQIQFPGGGKMRPIGTEVHQSIADYITPISGILGTVFSFFAPLFIILDVIRALIDMICSLFNPVPLIATVVEFFITVVPPLIALYPPLSSVLHALNTAKVVTAIAVSLLSHIIPIIDKIVENALSIAELIAQGNLAAIESVEIKICTLLRYFDNQIGAFAPIQFVIEILNLFLDLAASFFCIGDAECCNTENCPPIIVTPPSGVARVTRKLNRFTLKDVIDFILDYINPILDVIDDFITDVVQQALEPIEGQINDILQAVLDFLFVINGAFADIIDNGINALVGVVSGLSPIPLEIGVSSPSEPLNAIISALGADPNDPSSAEGALDIDVSAIDIDLTLQTPEFFEEIAFVLEEIDLGLFKDLTATEFGSSSLLSDPVATANDSERVTIEKNPGEPYSKQELARLLDFIVDPAKIPASQSTNDPATLRVRMRRLQRADGTEDGVTEVVRPVAFVADDIVTQILLGLGLAEDDQPTELTTLTIRSEDFDVGDIIEYTIEPDQIALLSTNLIGIGCQDDVFNVANGIRELVNADIDAADAVGGVALTGLDPLSSKTGRNFPPPPVEALQECLARQTADPTVSQEDCVNDIVQDYLDDLVDFYDAVLCVGASRASTIFESDKKFATSNGEDGIVVELQINDVGGNNLLLGKLPNSTARAEFFTTLGTVGPVLFDESTSRFRATITSADPGIAEISASFLINDQECVNPGTFDGFVVADQVLTVEFIPDGGTFPRRRRERIYRQARGGRRR